MPRGVGRTRFRLDIHSGAASGKLIAKMVYFHAAARAYSPGAVISARLGANSYAERVAAAGMSWIDEFMDARPLASAKPARGASVYCCPDLGCCARYADSEPHLARAYAVYEVVPRGRVHTAPMVLVGRIARRGAADHVGEAIADEYWNPSHPWRFLEVLAESLEVVRAVTKPDWMIVLAGDGCFQDDRDLAVRLGW